MQLQTRFLDEIDASKEGMNWLLEIGRVRGCQRVEAVVGESANGLVKSAWRDNTLVAYFIVVRDLQNWSVLVCHDVDPRTQAKVTIDGAP